MTNLCSMRIETPDTAHVMMYLNDGPALNNSIMGPGDECILSHFRDPRMMPLKSPMITHRFDILFEHNSSCRAMLHHCVNNTCMPPVDVSKSVCPTCGAENFCNPCGTCDPICNDNNECTTDSCVVDTYQISLFQGLFQGV